MIDRVFPNEFVKWSKQNSMEFSIIIMRTLMALVWLTEGLSKIINRDPNNKYEDYNGFLGQLNWAAATHPFKWMSKIIENFMLPNYEIIVVVVIAIELSIALSLGLGIFTRYGALAGGIMSLNLWFLTLGWGEWIWTYPLIFIPHFVLFFSHSGKNVGFDRYFSNHENKIINFMT